MASSSPVASDQGTIASFSLVGTDVADGEDYMLLDMTTAEAAPAVIEPEFVSDPTITKETLANQLMEMEKVMSELGLESKSGGGVAAHGAKAPPGFVPSAGQDSTETIRTREKETGWTRARAPSRLKDESPCCRLYRLVMGDQRHPPELAVASPGNLDLDHAVRPHSCGQQLKDVRELLERLQGQSDPFVTHSTESHLLFGVLHTLFR